MPDTRPERSALPRISVVTPSFNQGKYIEETIRSILLQGYPNLEYIVIDGGSTDNTLDVIRKYEAHLAYWISERDRGQSHAINKGLARCTGTVFNWVNSDDLLLPGALREVASAWVAQPDSIIAGGTEFFNDRGVFSTISARGQTLVNFVRFWEAADFGWAQQSTFLPLAAVHMLGGIREDLRYCMDYHLMVELLGCRLPVTYIDRPIARFRFHAASKTVGESRDFRLERVNMLRTLQGLPIQVSDWEWDREQAKRQVDIGLRDLRRGRWVEGMTMFGRAAATSPSGAAMEAGARLARRVARLTRWRSNAVSRMEDET